MNGENYIQVHQLCEHYKVEFSFFVNLHDFGLIELITIEEVPCVPEDRVGEIEKMIRMHHELEINFYRQSRQLFIRNSLGECRAKTIVAASRIAITDQQRAR